MVLCSAAVNNWCEWCTIESEELELLGSLLNQKLST